MADVSVLAVVQADSPAHAAGGGSWIVAYAINTSPACNNCHLDGFVSVAPTYDVRVVLQNKLGGGEGIEGLYGTLACSGMQKVLECMAAHCGMTEESRLVDMGAGIGRSA